VRLKRQKQPSPPRVHPDLKTDLTRSCLRLELDGRTATVRAEAFVPGHGSPDFEVFRKEIEWGDGSAVTEEDRDRILQTLIASADERGLRVEIV
jgi:hypothetical protein